MRFLSLSHSLISAIVKPDYYDINSSEKMLFAHRGLPGVAENSWLGFSQSQSLGFNAIECDVQYTKDHKLIVFHDKNAKRLLNIDQNINCLEWSEIQDKPITNNQKITNQYILTLEELFSLSSKFQYIYLDIKVTNKSIADSLLDLMDKYQTYDNVLVADANFLFLSYLKYKTSKIKIVLEGFNKGKEWIYHLIPQRFEPNYWASFFQQIDNNHIMFLKKNQLMHKKIVYVLIKTTFPMHLIKASNILL